MTSRLARRLNSSDDGVALVTAIGIIALVTILLLTGCAGQNVVELGIGPKVMGEWEGDGGVVEIALRRENGWTYCEYRHTSNLLSGPPFNDRYENSLDRVICGVRLKP